MKTEDMKFWKMVFSEQGRPSSKRVLGAFMIIVCLGLLVFLVIKAANMAVEADDVCPDNLKDLMELLLVLASSLLGISSITGIWKNNGGNFKAKFKDEATGKEVSEGEEEY